MQHVTLTTIEIPFGKLVPSKDNVRVTRPEKESLEQLAASISAVGLLQSLVVQPAARGRYAIVAGARRWAALSRLREAGGITASYKVPCRVLPKEADATEASLSENVQREAMEPLDECAAFERLFEKGHSVADIAARFGYTEALVERRLALARLSPVLLDHYRSGEATLELLQAFTLTGDHARQEQVWMELPEWNRNADIVRRLLSQKDIPANDAQVRFVTLAAYETAGGRTKRDLFADEDGNGVFLLDADILNRLATDKLQQEAEKVRAEGWQWVEIDPEADFATLAKFRRIPGEPAPLPKKQEAKRVKLSEELEQLAAQLEDAEEGSEESERLDGRFQKVEEQIEAIDNARPLLFPDSIRQNCGVIVALDDNGEIRFHRGLMRKQDEADVRADTEAEEESNSDAPGENAPGYSAALIQTLTTVKTAAIAVELAQQPRIALATLVYTLVHHQFGFDLQDYRQRSALHLSLSPAHLGEVEDTAPGVRLSELRQELVALLPDAGDLWNWCLAQSEATLLRLLAFCTATAVNAIQAKGQSDALRIAHADQLAQALNLDMNRWFTPTADNFFSRISKPQIAQALREIGKPAENATLVLKKAQLAAAAEAKVAGTGWLPEALRVTQQSE